MLLCVSINPGSHALPSPSSHKWITIIELSSEKLSTLIYRWSLLVSFLSIPNLTISVKLIDTVLESFKGSLFLLDTVGDHAQRLNTGNDSGIHFRATLLRGLMDCVGIRDSGIIFNSNKTVCIIQSISPEKWPMRIGLTANK